MQFEERQTVSGQKTQFLLVSCGQSRYKPCPSGSPRTTATVTNEIPLQQLPMNLETLSPKYSVSVCLLQESGFKYASPDIGCIFQFYSPASFLCRSTCRRISSHWWSEDKQRFFSLIIFSLIIPRRRKVLGKDKWKLSSSFKYITPQISCLSKSEIPTTKDNEIIKD